MIGAVLTAWRWIASPVGRWLAVAALTVAVGAGGYIRGRGDGSVLVEARHAAELAAAVLAAQDRTADIMRAEAARLARERESDDEFRRLSDEARSDPDADRPAFSLRSARRLNAIR